MHSQEQLATESQGPELDQHGDSKQVSDRCLLSQLQEEWGEKHPWGLLAGGKDQALCSGGNLP